MYHTIVYYIKTALNNSNLILLYYLFHRNIWLWDHLTLFT